MLQKKGSSGGLLNVYGDGAAWFRGSMIGKGGFGSVYMATKSPRSKFSCYPSVMAVKSAEISVSASIQKETQILRDVKGCSDIITCYGDETTIGHNGLIIYNLLMEYGSGGTLGERIRNSGGFGLPESEVKVFARCILRGLRHIHEAGYVHCDLKPDNVLLFPNGRSKGVKFRAKICDFGLAKRAIQSKKRKMEVHWRGTPMYLSPEAALDKVHDSMSDILAFGCIVLEMLSGKPMWDEEKDKKAEEVLSKIGGTHDLPKLPTNLSPEAISFLKGCIARKPEFRFTAEMLLSHTFLQDLEDDHEDTVQEIDALSEDESILLVCGSEDEWSNSYTDFSDQEWILDSEDDFDSSETREQQQGSEETSKGVVSSISIENEFSQETKRRSSQATVQ